MSRRTSRKPWRTTQTERRCVCVIERCYAISERVRTNSPSPCKFASFNLVAHKLRAACKVRPWRNHERAPHREHRTNTVVNERFEFDPLIIELKWNPIADGNARVHKSNCRRTHAKRATRLSRRTLIYRRRRSSASMFARNRARRVRFCQIRCAPCGAQRGSFRRAGSAHRASAARAC